MIGVSATYREEAGVKKIKTILKGSIFIATPTELKEKELQLEVVGRLTKQEIVT